MFFLVILDHTCEAISSESSEDQFFYHCPIILDEFRRNNYWNHLEHFFQKYLVKKSRTMSKNPKRGNLGSLNVFLQIENQKM